MSVNNYIGVSMPILYVSGKQYKDIQRPCGMNSIVYMSPAYPTAKIYDSLCANLAKDYVLVIFNPDDTVRSIGRK
jgi:hypothetical protein